MPSKSTPATDSARELNRITGDDATATFEDDPRFTPSNPTESASSENLGPATDDDDEEDDVDETDDVDEDDEFEEDDEDDLDEDDDEAGDEEDDEGEYEIDDEDEDAGEDEDDADEVKASSASLQATNPRGTEGDDDARDDGRENAVDEDKLDADIDDLDTEDAPLTHDEAADLHERLSVAAWVPPAHLAGGALLPR